MSQEAVRLKTLPGVVTYWKECIAEADQTSVMDAAWPMADVMGNDLFDDWYNEGKGDPLFVEAFELATELEIPDDTPERRAAKWRRIKELVAELAKKYQS